MTLLQIMQVQAVSQENQVGGLMVALDLVTTVLFVPVISVGLCQGKRFRLAISEVIVPPISGPLCHFGYSGEIAASCVSRTV